MHQFIFRTSLFVGSWNLLLVASNLDAIIVCVVSKQSDIRLHDVVNEAFIS
jgi:hypothetical protein